MICWAVGCVIGRVSLPLLLFVLDAVIVGVSSVVIWLGSVSVGFFPPVVAEISVDIVVTCPVSTKYNSVLLLQSFSSVRETVSCSMNSAIFDRDPREPVRTLFRIAPRERLFPSPPGRSHVKPSQNRGS